MDPLTKILIVDDDESILETLYRFFRITGIEVIKCQELSKAEYAIRHQPFNAVIADVRLTGGNKMEGLDLLSYIKEHSPQTKVIIMTAYGSPDIVKKAYQRGATYYFKKPIDLNLLQEKMKEFGILS